MITSTQIRNQNCLQIEKKVRFKQFTTTGGANENLKNLILKENLIKKKIIFLIILLFNINYLNKNYLTN
jgi:hypothetical protein